MEVWSEECDQIPAKLHQQHLHIILIYKQTFAAIRGLGEMQEGPGEWGSPEVGRFA